LRGEGGILGRDLERNEFFKKAKDILPVLPERIGTLHKERLKTGTQEDWATRTTTRNLANPQIRETLREIAAKAAADASQETALGVDEAKWQAARDVVLGKTYDRGGGGVANWFGRNWAEDAWGLGFGPKGTTAVTTAGATVGREIERTVGIGSGKYEDDPLLMGIRKIAELLGIVVDQGRGTKRPAIVADSMAPHN